jgi:acyl-CoA hydrolase
MKKRYVKSSQVEMTQLVLPNDTNQLGNLLGGRLMEWMDIAAAIAAQRHSNRVCVTASVDELVFHYPIHLGEVVTLKASVNRVFTTSMEVGVKVIAENQLTQQKKIANTAYFSFVGVDETNAPTAIPPIVPQSQDEKRRFADALARRRHRLQKYAAEKKQRESKRDRG